MANDKESIEGGIGRFHFRVTGPEGVIAILVILVNMLVGFFVWTNLQSQNETMAQLLKQHEEIASGMDALIYINSLSQEEKEKIHLEMPRRLREMLHRGVDSAGQRSR